MPFLNVHNSVTDGNINVENFRKRSLNIPSLNKFAIFVNFMLFLLNWLRDFSEQMMFVVHGVVIIKRVWF